MNVSAHRAFALMKDMSFERVSCSEGEKRAAERILADLKAAGVDAHMEEFPVPFGKCTHAKLVVTEPYVKEYEVNGYLRAANTPEGGLDGEFYYAADVLPGNLRHVKDKIVLMNGYLRRVTYEKLIKAGAKAIITFSGTTMDRRSESDCDIRVMRDQLVENVGKAVAMHIRTLDAVEIVRRGAKRMHLELQGECYEGTSQNVCAVIEGTEYPEEIISVGAHYDTTFFSHGMYDNISGSAIILELARYFAVHKPARTLKFNWYGSEEQGLFGSKAWVKAHEDELDKHVLMINADMAATTLGSDWIPVLGTPAAVNYVDGVMTEIGAAVDVTADIYSSDCMPFADYGIPSVNLVRRGVGGAVYGHDRKDCLKSNFVDASGLNYTLQIAFEFTKRVANAAACPIKREISDDLKAKVDEYLAKGKKN